MMQHSQAMAIIAAAALLSEKESGPDEVRALEKIEPIRNVNPQFRNASCKCGSGKKYKKCCKT